MKSAFAAFSETPIRCIAPDGQWQADESLKLPLPTLERLYRDMLAARLLDEKLALLVRSGKTSFHAPHAGHEAAQVAVAHAVKHGHDWIFPYYRDYGIAVALGVPWVEIFGQILGTYADPAKARQMPMHPSSRPLNLFTACSAIASHVPPAVGAALSMQIQRRDQVVVCTFGDGATSEGDWHAAVNFAAVRRAPIVFVCENNRYAISVPLGEQTASTNITLKAKAYGIAGYWVDGLDVVASLNVLRHVVALARAGTGPVLVELMVHRFGPHSSADDDSRYRPQEERQTMRAECPLWRLQRYLEREGAFDAAQVQQWQQTICAEMDAAIEEALAAGAPGIEAMFDDVYAEMPWHLAAQRAELAAVIG